MLGNGIGSQTSTLGVVIEGNVRSGRQPFLPVAAGELQFRHHELDGFDRGEYLKTILT